MQVVNAVTQGMSAIEVRPSDCETQKMLRSQQLRVAQAAQNGFISRDMQARLNVTPEELLAIQNSSMRLLGGGRKRIIQDVVTLKPDTSFYVETDRFLGRKVHVETKDDAKVHITIVFNGNEIFNESFSGTRDFAKGLPDGHFKVTLNNTSSEEARVYLHVEDESKKCPLWG